MTATHGHRGVGRRRRQRPIGALCVWCNHRPASPNRRYPYLATNWCSDTHRQADMRARKNARRAELAEEIRRHLGLPAGRGADFTAPELQAITSRLRRIVSHHPGRAQPRTRPPQEGAAHGA
jgi:hypothetical protein